MNTCKNCSYWTRRTLYETKITRNDGSSYNDCIDHKPYNYHNEKIINTIPSKFGECKCEKIIYTQAGGCVEDDDMNKDNPTDALLYSDGEAYGAYHMTGEDFGCIHWRVD